MNTQQSQNTDTDTDNQDVQSIIAFDPEALLLEDYLNHGSLALFTHISSLYQVNEDNFIKKLLLLTQPNYDQKKSVEKLARQITNYIRKHPDATHNVNELLLEYNLETPEGKSLISLVEGLSRIPDTYGTNAFIADKLTCATWKTNLKVNSSTHLKKTSRYLAFGSKVFNPDYKVNELSLFERIGQHVGEPFIRLYLHRLTKRITNQFICSHTIDTAQIATNGQRSKGYSHCFDLLANHTITQDGADNNLNNYISAIKDLAKIQSTEHSARPSLTIKLSALHPRYHAFHAHTVLADVSKKVIQLIQQAREANVDMMIDCENEDALELTLQLFDYVYRDSASQGWNGLGLTVKTYSKRTLAVLAWIASLAKEVGDRITVRVTKGDDWASEIKHAQQQGFADYAVLTRKENTDLAYLACAKFLLADHISDLILPQFATHNVQTIANIITMSKHKNFEIHQLYGVNDILSSYLLETHKLKIRIHTPVSDYKNSIRYAVRRLIEMSDKDSSVYQLINKQYSVSSLIEHPAEILAGYQSFSNPAIASPLDIYEGRQTSVLPNIMIDDQWLSFAEELGEAHTLTWEATNFINGVELANDIVGGLSVVSPFNHDNVVGITHLGTVELAEYAVGIANKSQASWQAIDVKKRSDIVRRIADLYEEKYIELVSLCQREAGKTIQDAQDEVRHAIDLCRFYADDAEFVVNEIITCDDINGDSVRQARQPRGTLICMSTCTSPVANFTEQVIASLLTGNTVVAKSAEQTSLTAHYALLLMYEAGIPHSALQFIVGGEEIGTALVKAQSVDGIVFTGTAKTAQAINQSLYQKPISESISSVNDLPIFVAHSGGQNALIANSTAEPLDVALDAVKSAFASTGQHCGGCRILCVQTDIADHVIELIKGYMAQLVVGNPLLRETDIGAVIDQKSQTQILAHIERMDKMHDANIIYQTPIAESWKSHLHHATFVRPTLIEVNSISLINKEHFGPVLHVLRYKSNELDNLIEQINNTSYRLTLGIHSRIDSFAEYIEQRTSNGNTYINRDQLGSIAGVQPFGGSGLSGTAPQSGGKNYLARLMKWVEV